MTSAELQFLLYLQSKHLVTIITTALVNSTGIAMDMVDGYHLILVSFTKALVTCHEPLLTH